MPRMPGCELENALFTGVARRTVDCYQVQDLGIVQSTQRRKDLRMDSRSKNARDQPR